MENQEKKTKKNVYNSVHAKEMIGTDQMKQKNARNRDRMTEISAGIRCDVDQFDINPTKNSFI